MVRNMSSLQLREFTYRCCLHLHNAEQQSKQASKASNKNMQLVDTLFQLRECGAINRQHISKSNVKYLSSCATLQLETKGMFLIA